MQAGEHTVWASALDPGVVVQNRSKAANALVRRIVGSFSSWRMWTGLDHRRPDIIWCGAEASKGLLKDDLFLGLSPSQRVNRIAGMNEALCKSSLDTVLRVRRILEPDRFAFRPRTWLLPGLGSVERGGSWASILAGHDTMRSGCPTAGGPAQSKRPTHLILKPSQGSEGRGIVIVPRDEAALVEAAAGAAGTVVAEEYLDDPMLIEGCKFDLRVYLLICNLEPLEAYLCRDGLCRLATHPYERPNPSNMANTTMHLTNYSINCHSDSFVPGGVPGGASAGTDGERSSGPRSLGTKRRLLDFLESLPHSERSVVWDQLRNIAGSVARALQPYLLMR